MPTPIGHALGGVAAGTLVVRQFPLDIRLRGLRLSAPLLFAFLGMLPDIDFVGVAAHRHATHSIAAAILAGGLTVFIAPRQPRVWVASAAAYGTHVLLDWLGTDTVAPFGLMALWPFDTAHYQSSLGWFYPVCREYWLFECWVALAWSVYYEVLFIGPFALAGVLLMRRKIGVRSVHPSGR